MHETMSGSAIDFLPLLLSWSNASRSTSLAELFGWVFGLVVGWVVAVRVLDSIANMANMMQVIYVKSMFGGGFFFIFYLESIRLFRGGYIVWICEYMNSTNKSPH